MKTRTLVLIPIFIFVVVAIFIFASCDNNGGVTPSFLGTWVNLDYGGGGPPEKVVVTDSGDGTFTFVCYDTVSDTEPLFTFIKTLTDEWTDSEGNLFCKVEGPQNSEYFYSLFKIHSDNQTMEVDSSEVDYPTEIVPDGEGYYQIFYRQ